MFVKSQCFYAKNKNAYLFDARWEAISAWNKRKGNVKKVIKTYVNMLNTIVKNYMFDVKNFIPTWATAKWNYQNFIEKNGIIKSRTLLLITICSKKKSNYLIEIDFLSITLSTNKEQKQQHAKQLLKICLSLMYEKCLFHVENFHCEFKRLDYFHLMFK